ncbi:hypothetical protein [Novipirellula sp.]
MSSGLFSFYVVAANAGWIKLPQAINDRLTLPIFPMIQVAPPSW